MPTPDDDSIRQSLLWSLVKQDGPTAPTRNVRRQLEAYRESVRQDLQDMLNTRQRSRSCPTELEELRRSVFEYGIVDVTGANLASEERRSSFLVELGAVIERQEPRLSNVRVSALENSDRDDRTLRFRIEATLRIETEAETTSFDFHMEPVSRRIE